MTSPSHELAAKREKCTPGTWTQVYDVNIKAPDPRGGTLCPLSNSNLDIEVRARNYEFICFAANNAAAIKAEVEGIYDDLRVCVRQRDALERERDEMRPYASAWKHIMETIEACHNAGVCNELKGNAALDAYIDVWRRLTAEVEEARAECERLRAALKQIEELTFGGKGQSAVNIIASEALREPYEPYIPEGYHIREDGDYGEVLVKNTETPNPYVCQKCGAPMIHSRLHGLSCSTCR